MPEAPKFVRHDRLPCLLAPVDAAIEQGAGVQHKKPLIMEASTCFLGDIPSAGHGYWVEAAALQMRKMVSMIGTMSR